MPTTKDSPNIWSKTIWQLNFKPRSSGCSSNVFFFRRKEPWRLPMGLRSTDPCGASIWNGPDLRVGQFLSSFVVVDGERSGYSNSTTVNYISDVMGCPQQFKECQSMPEHFGQCWVVGCFPCADAYDAWCRNAIGKDPSGMQALCDVLKCAIFTADSSVMFSELMLAVGPVGYGSSWSSSNHSNPPIWVIFIRRMFFFSCFFICFGYPIWTVLRSS